MRMCSVVRPEMTERRFSEYADRNGLAILEVLRHEFSTATSVLEIGSGTGQHAVRIASAMGHLNWQCSDLDENHESISAWLALAKLANVLAPVSLDVRTAQLPTSAYDAIFSANTAHIMSIESVKRMFALVGETLTDGGIFCLYGPFQEAGECSSPSNAAFHQSLRSRDPAMGIRDIEQLDEFGEYSNLRRRRLYAMPANNNIGVWIKDRQKGSDNDHA